MKSFGIWLVIFLALFGGLFLVNHLTLSAVPRKILIAIDESYAMQSAERKIQNFVKEQKNRLYTQFSIITDKKEIHSWQENPKLAGFNAFGPRDLVKILDNNRYPQIEEADEIIVLTNARDTTSLGAEKNIQIRQLTPLTD